MNFLSFGRRGKYFKTAGAGTDADPHVPATSVEPVAMLAEAGTTVAQANELVAAPGAGNRIVVSYLYAHDEAGTGNAIEFRDGATAFARFDKDNTPFAIGPVPAGREFRLTENTALNMQLQNATLTGYTVWYFVEAV